MAASRFYPIQWVRIFNGNSHARSDFGAGSLGLAGLGFGRVAIAVAREDAGI
ncbi:MAG: hypothetical protein RKP20_09150 [Candidatus Competibacter sp.]|nr:hypothetical protein [Candidatus Competibacter sp.]